MRLPKPFYRLPLQFDVDRLRSEVAALSPSAWAAHPNAIPGNSSVRLISVDAGENDDVDGVMLSTPHLAQSPYIRQILAAFGVVWSRSRLLKLAPGAVVPEHADINYHWYSRVRLHIPIVTRPEVRFHCGDESVHMAAGEAWVFDNWRRHRVENPTSDERIHLVADTSGSAAFWRLVAQSEQESGVHRVAYAPEKDAKPLTERTVLAPVMTPAEVDLLIADLRDELVVAEDSVPMRARLVRYRGMLDALCRDWRQLYALHGDTQQGWQEFEKLRDSVRAISRKDCEGLVMRTNSVGVHPVLEGRLLRAMLSLPTAPRAIPLPRRATSTVSSPVFIVAAPRSGSTLLFETLASSGNVCTLGGEAHWLVEGMSSFHPVAGQVDSNRLTEAHATDAVAEHIRQQIAGSLRDQSGQPLTAAGARVFLEKTPKNALRIPFFRRIFPDARFIFLWRDPRENIASIMEAWRDGRWITYPRLPGFDGPWSLLLPPGWQQMSGKALAEIAAWQWEQANSIVLSDLRNMPAECWTAVSYAQLLGAPDATVRRLGEFMMLDRDEKLAQRLRSSLPHSRYTLTAPDAEKWRAHEVEILRVLPTITATWHQLQKLSA